MSMPTDKSLATLSRDGNPMTPRLLLWFARDKTRARVSSPWGVPHKLLNCPNKCLSWQQRLSLATHDEERCWEQSGPCPLESLGLRFLLYALYCFFLFLPATMSQFGQLMIPSWWTLSASLCPRVILLSTDPARGGLGNHFTTSLNFEFYIATDGW